MGSQSNRAKTVLVVDDEGPIRKLVVNILSREGYVVFEASNPTEAWKIWYRERSSIDLLFTDIILPMMSGPELAREFVLMQPELKVVFATGSSRLVVRETMDLIPHKHFLEKPYTAQDLKKAIASAFEE